MKKKIFMFLVALIATTGVWAQNCAEVSPYAATTQSSHIPQMQRRAAASIGDLVLSFNAYEAGQYGIVTDGTYFYTSNWGYSEAEYQFCKYDLEGNFIEGFGISGVGTCRGITFDGTYVYGVANGNTIYQMDFTNKTLVSTITIDVVARGIAYDYTSDGFWVVGNWAEPLALYNRSGVQVKTGIYSGSVSDIAYYLDTDGEEHILQCNNGTNDVYDYNITTNTLNTTPIFSLNSIPGYNGGSSGGCHIGIVNNQAYFFANVQQDPNLIGVYALPNAYVESYDIVAGTSEHGTLTFLVDGEEVEGEPVQAKPGQEVTVVVTPEEGWISSSVIARPYSSWEVAAARGAAQDIEIIQPINATKTALRNQWTFTMPANNVEVGVNYIDTDDVIELLRQETELAMMLFRSFGDTKDEELLKEMFKAIGQANSLLKKYDSGQDVSLDDAQNLLELLQSFNDQFADVVTGITGVNQNENQNQYYDLQGRRVAQPTKGLYIQGGRKVLIK